jgi:putative ABC transport system ATP-binding protein
MNARTTTVLSTENVSVTYGEGPTAVNALRGVSATVSAGEMLVLMGPSGSGKTTLLQVLGCVLPPTSGEIRVGGRQTVGLSEAERCEIRRRFFGFVVQSYNLFPTLTATENVEVALDLAGVRGAEARERSCELLDLVGLGSRLSSFPAELSGGQKQRVAIARALATDPPVILADEPTANLDSTNGAQVTRLLRELGDRGRASVVVTHDPRVAQVGHRVLVLEDGVLAGESRSSGSLQ